MYKNNPCILNYFYKVILICIYVYQYIIYSCKIDSRAFNFYFCIIYKYLKKKVENK